MPAAWSAPRRLWRRARELGDQDLVIWTLTACGGMSYYSPESARRYFTEAAELAQAVNNLPMLCHIRGYQAFSANVAGEPADVTVGRRGGPRHRGHDR